MLNCTILIKHLPKLNVVLGQFFKCRKTLIIKVRVLNLSFGTCWEVEAEHVHLIN